MSKLIYYRGQELVTPEQRDLIIKLWGTEEQTPYNYFEEYEQFDAYPTGLYNVYQLMMTIENDRGLSDECKILQERIKKNLLNKGRLTPSSGYYSTSVEHNMLNKLMAKAVEVYNSYVDEEDKIEAFKVSWEEVVRLFGLPRTKKSVLNKVEEQNKRLVNRPKSRGAANIKFDYELGFGDQCSIYKYYYVYGDLNNYNVYDYIPKDLLCFVGKILHPYGYGFGAGKQDRFQLYVYDYANSDYIAQQVIQALKKAGVVTLTKKDSK